MECEVFFAPLGGFAAEMVPKDTVVGGFVAIANLQRYLVERERRVGQELQSIRHAQVVDVFVEGLASGPAEHGSEIGMVDVHGTCQIIARDALLRIEFGFFADSAETVKKHLILLLVSGFGRLTGGSGNRRGEGLLCDLTATVLLQLVQRQREKVDIHVACFALGENVVDIEVGECPKDKAGETVDEVAYQVRQPEHR